VPEAAQPHFFISYTGADRVWAEWIAWQLEEAGHKVKILAWDFSPGGNFVVEMQKATVECERTIRRVFTELFLVGIRRSGMGRRVQARSDGQK
jgi:hypothetical protein